MTFATYRTTNYLILNLVRIKLFGKLPIKCITFNAHVRAQLSILNKIMIKLLVDCIKNKTRCILKKWFHFD